jgi:uncharacterized SAM-binding protein YcdF (DUF218 family)
VARALRFVAVAAGVFLFVFLAGFVIFASTVGRYTTSPGEHADGIVVLTGGEHRLMEAARLLAEGKASRLLISGVNRSTSREDLKRKSGLPGPLFDEHVDIDWALDTSGNAEETKKWATRRGLSKLIIVTSSYHMPRSLIELARVMPEAVLIPYPVVSRNVRAGGWWLHAGTTRLLFFEYLKFLPSAARFALSRLGHPWNDSALARGRAHGPPA